MSEIFKALCQDTTTAPKFGIRDGEPHQRAYILETDGQHWTVTVNNYYRKEIVFTALDYCIEFNKPDGKMEPRCEGVITCEDTIVFIEIKERTGDARTWAKKADAQLRNSIRLVSAKVDTQHFTDRRAYICNPFRNRLNTNHAARAKQFQDDTGYILRVTNRIEMS